MCSPKKVAREWEGIHIKLLAVGCEREKFKMRGFGFPAVIITIMI